MPADSDAIIAVEHLTYEIEGKHVLDDVSFEVCRGEVFGVMGLSGAGKSTLLHNIMRLVQPKAGRILVNGVDITHAPEHELNAVRLQMGLSFQYSALFDSMTVFDNVAFGLRRRGEAEDTIREKVAHLLEIVDMSGTEHEMPSNLSGGMRKRVSVARALATDPEVVLYDEPTSGLDPVLASAIDHLISRLRDDLGVSAIVVTHDVPHLFGYADRAMMLYEGKTIACGTPEELRNSDNPVLRQFITGSIEGPIKV
jgi:phospholipid/cholesterol/gamma-HCH transport system ATP-binding protein